MCCYTRSYNWLLLQDCNFGGDLLCRVPVVVMHRVLNLFGKVSALAHSAHGIVRKLACAGANMHAPLQIQPVGLARFQFEQFRGSPHVRVADCILYDGTWWGVPLFTKLVPHGEGTCLFLEGWGTVPEERIIHITVHAADGLNPPSIVRPAPCIRIRANGREV